MATYLGVDGILKIGANAMGELRSWSIDMSSALIETTAKGASYRANKAGLADCSGTATAAWFSTDTVQAALTEGASVTLVLYPEGSAGSTYTVPCIISNVKIDSPREGDTMGTFDFVGNGAIT